MPSGRVLLIDYDPDSIELMSRPLREAGFEVGVARDGVSGLEAFDKQLPDLVLVEAMLPRKGGFDVCREIKRSDRGKHVPVLITTAVYRGRRYRTEAFANYGCDDYLEKPVPGEQLVGICSRFVEQSRSAPPAASEPSMLEEAAAPDPDARPLGAGALPDLADLSEEEIASRLDVLLQKIQAVPPVEEPAPAPAPDPAPAAALPSKIRVSSVTLPMGAAPVRPVSASKTLTTLAIPAAPGPEPIAHAPSRSGRSGITVAAAALVVCVAGGWWWFKHNPPPQEPVVAPPPQAEHRLTVLPPVSAPDPLPVTAAVPQAASPLAEPAPAPAAERPPETETTEAMAAPPPPPKRTPAVAARPPTA
ncbi:MAG TPA: response regulator, partial [Candidatus Polarisedimenticolaceae bacterium]|nr:response regulator [Candidatus Polarisedimenticolaceae bacterium]